MIILFGYMLKANDRLLLHLTSPFAYLEETIVIIHHPRKTAIVKGKMMATTLMTQPAFHFIEYESAIHYDYFKFSS